MWIVKFHRVGILGLWGKDLADILNDFNNITMDGIVKEFWEL